MLPPPHPPSPPFFFFFVEFSVSPFQTFFNSGIKGDGGIGEIRLRDPPGIVWESADKKSIALVLIWQGGGWVGWGGGREVAGGAEPADLGGRWRYCSVGCCLAFQKKRNRLYLDGVDAAAASCLLFQEKYQFPVWIWHNGRLQIIPNQSPQWDTATSFFLKFKNCHKCPKMWSKPG